MKALSNLNQLVCQCFRQRQRLSRSRSLRIEKMEARELMAADISDSLSLNQQRRFDSAWFEQLTPAAAQRSDHSTEGKVAKVSWRGSIVDAVPHEWIIQFHSNAEIRNANQAATYFAQISPAIQVVGGLGSSGQFLVRAPHISTEDIVKSIAKRPELEFVEPNMLSQEMRVPNDPLFSSLYGLRNSSDRDIDADQAWDLTTGKKNIVIGVLDSGVDFTHPDLAANIWTNPGEIPGDRIDNDGNGFVDDVHGFDFVNWDSNPMDGHGHGTHVAGTIAAVGNNQTGVTGVAWNSSIMAIQILDSSGYGTSYANIISAINYVTMMRVDFGVNVRATNNSWGGGGYSQALRNAITVSGQADILFVAAAGNSNLNNDLAPFYPASYDSPNIISVAAVDANGRFAAFSNFGASSVDIAAPGVDILSTLPGNSYGYMSGTSMAAPYVTGTIALAASINPELGATDLKTIVQSTTDRLSDLRKATLTKGRVNAHQSILRARSTVGEADRFGVWRPQGGLFFADTGAPGYNGERSVQFGLPGDIPIAGDWDGDGRDTIGVFRPNGGWFFLDVNKPGYNGEGAFQFGLAGDLPVSGDWNGDGIDDVGVFRPGTGQFYLDAGPRGYNGEQPFQFGLNGDFPIAGDWNGDRIDDVGVFRPNGRNFFLDSGPRGFNGERPFKWTGPGDLPFAGDWDRDGRDNVGMFVSNGGRAILDTGPRGFNGETSIQFGLAGDFPVSGIWNRSVVISGSNASSVAGFSGMRIASYSGTYQSKSDSADLSRADWGNSPHDANISLRDAAFYDFIAGDSSDLRAHTGSQSITSRVPTSDKVVAVDFALYELSEDPLGVRSRSSRRHA